MPAGKIPLHIPLVIQDKTLDSAGRLVYPYPWTPEFFGDTCLVNGKAFPYLDVQPREYRFTFLNGSQSRFYNLVFNKAVRSPRSASSSGCSTRRSRSGASCIAPAERADVVVDFSGLRDRHQGRARRHRAPCRRRVSPTRPLGDCMQFRVVGPALTEPDPFAGAPVLPGWGAATPTPRPGSRRRTSKVTLEEVLGRGGKPHDGRRERHALHGARRARIR